MFHPRLPLLRRHPGRVIDAVTPFKQMPGERIAAVVANEFSIRDHPPQAGTRRAGADAEQ